MKLIQANIWDYENQFDYICITTNAISKSNGNLVFGAGIAKQADQRHPKLKVEYGKQLRERGLFNKFYGLLLAEKKYIAFQTKYHWNSNSPLELVQRSIEMLIRLANKYPDKTFALPNKGINNGCLHPNVVLPALKQLPDNVTVFHLRNL